MYSDKQKLAFIASKKYSDSMYKNVLFIFSITSIFEEKYHKDVSQMSEIELNETLNELSILKKRNSFVSIITAIKEYIIWCRDNDYQISYSIFNVKIEEIEKFKTKMVSSPKHLRRILDTHFDQPQKETIDVVYRTYLWLAYAGMWDRDAIRVCKTDIDFSLLRVCFNGQSYELYKEGMEDISKACDLERFFFDHPYYSTWKDRVEGNAILRGLSSVPTLSNMRAKVNIHLKNNEAQKITYNNIRLSGTFYRAYEMEKEGFEVDFSPVVDLEMNKREIRRKESFATSETYTREVMKGRIKSELEKDYEKWKCAYIK